MKNYGLTYLAGMLCIFLAERMLSAEGSGRIAFDLIGAGLLVYTVSLCQKEHNPQNKAFSLPTAFAGVGILSLLVYALGTDAVIDRIGLDDDGEHTFKVAVSSIWPIIWLSGTLPFLALNVLIQKGQKHVSHKRAKNHAMQWLGFAFAISAIFPINYVAHETNVRWNVSYFKTALPGSSTQNIVANLSSPITAHLFFPTSSDVREEIRSYFDLLQDENL
ncbi:MAG: hypothetical protein VX278_08840, partial [Myxococcota bacterium]|nr:hypothetical protein [Myxococcota bacterium]